ncbi:DUF2206 domain-containing protein [Halosimplex salinum]|uniref:DUF2206 domain-containing protein n=1 Tax=Halosimplex salinum TaxID=1710538 RepID=UPI000F491EE2|nr:DUF2206 domain-containing protein [Halosimplex salinum]
MTAASDHEIHAPLGESRGRSLSVTSRRVTAAVLVLQALVLAIVGLEWVGLPLPVVRPVVTVVYLTFVPGYLLLRIVGVTDTSHVETVIYSVGLSLVSLMGVGVVANFALRQVGVVRPVSEGPMVLSVGAFVCVLTWVYFTRVEADRWATVDTRQLTSPTVLTLALLPLAGIYGGLILTRFGDNTLLIVLYGAVLVVPVLVVAGRLPDHLLPYVVWIVALSLLLQNTLSGHFLAWGDSPKEASLALNVVRDGYWDPALAPSHGNKYAMLRIVFLHPIYALFTDLKFVWVFKLVHPLIFSLTPVALYHAYEQYLEERAAFLSVFLYVSLFSYFVVLSRNTRTATALFFVSLFAAMVASDRIPFARRKILGILFVAGVVVSHYGVSYMFMLALVLVVPVRLVLDRVSPRNRTETPFTSPVFAFLYGTILFAWYIYASPGGKAFDTLLGFADSFLVRLTAQYVADPDSASATARYLTSDFTSATLSVLRLYNVLVGLVIVVGLALTYWRLIRGSDVEFDTEYVALASVALVIFGITFLPVERFNTARTYATTLLFFAPFFVLGVRQPIELVAQYLEPVGRLDPHHFVTPALLLFLALNVGFVSATVTHEYSTNALVEKDRIMDDGAPPEKNYFYKQYPTVYGVSGTEWLLSTGADNSTLYRSNWPGGTKSAVGHRPLAAPPGGDSASATLWRKPLEREMFADNATVDEGYLFLSAYNDERFGNIISLPSHHFVFEYVETSESRDHWGDKHLIYDNGGSRVYYGQNRTASEVASGTGPE